jgi:hypothetical protein
MTFRFSFIIILLLILTSGFTIVNPPSNPPDARPADFNLVYEWQEGSSRAGATRLVGQT